MDTNHTLPIRNSQSEIRIPTVAVRKDHHQPDSTEPFATRNQSYPKLSKAFREKNLKPLSNQKTIKSLAVKQKDPLIFLLKNHAISCAINPIQTVAAECTLNPQFAIRIPQLTAPQLRLPSAFNPLNCPFLFIMHWNVIFADTAAPATASQAAPAAAGSAAPGAPQTSPIWGNPIILFALLGLMMYFLVFRPQQQRAKQQAKLLSNLKSGDKIVTSSGIVGTVITVKDKTVSIRSADAKMEITKSSVTEILESSDDTQSSP